MRKASTYFFVLGCTLFVLDRILNGIVFFLLMNQQFNSGDIMDTVFGYTEPFMSYSAFIALFFGIILRLFAPSSRSVATGVLPGQVDAHQTSGILQKITDFRKSPLPFLKTATPAVSSLQVPLPSQSGVLSQQERDFDFWKTAIIIGFFVWFPVGIAVVDGAGVYPAMLWIHMFTLVLSVVCFVLALLRVKTNPVVAIRIIKIPFVYGVCLVVLLAFQLMREGKKNEERNQEEARQSAAYNAIHPKLLADSVSAIRGDHPIRIIAEFQNGKKFTAYFYYGRFIRVDEPAQDGKSERSIVWREGKVYIGSLASSQFDELDDSDPEVMKVLGKDIIVEQLIHDDSSGKLTWQKENDDTFTTTGWIPDIENAQYWDIKFTRGHPQGSMRSVISSVSFRLSKHPEDSWQVVNLSFDNSMSLDEILKWPEISSSDAEAAFTGKHGGKIPDTVGALQGDSTQLLKQTLQSMFAQNPWKIREVRKDLDARSKVLLMRDGRIVKSVYGVWTYIAKQGKVFVLDPEKKTFREYQLDSTEGHENEDRMNGNLYANQVIWDIAAFKTAYGPTALNISWRKDPDNTFVFTGQSKDTRYTQIHFDNYTDGVRVVTLSFDREVDEQMEFIPMGLSDIDSELYFPSDYTKVQY